MAKKVSMTRQEQIQYERAMQVYKRDDLIQKGRMQLSVQEQRAVLYAISKIKPTDSAFEEYSFDIKDFYDICGIEKDYSYTELKKMLKGLSDRSWWAINPETGGERVTRWFDKVEVNKDSSTVTLTFHSSMIPYLLRLVEQGEFYTTYELKYILPMRSKYSQRLYEILKSYQKNNLTWYFSIEELRYIMDCEQYTNFKDFRNRALTPAVEEINQFSDLKIDYKAEKTGRRVTKVLFMMVEKTQQEKIEVDRLVEESLDGQLSIDQVEEFWSPNDPFVRLMEEHRKAQEYEKAMKKKREEYLK